MAMAGGMLLFLLLGFTSALTPLPPPTSSSSSPWMDTSLCPLTDSLMVCQLKKGICSPINTIFSPAGGPVKAITTCANSTGATLGPQFFMSVGLTFLSGSPASLADKASSDPATATAIRRCALNATGLLNPDLLTLNRTAVSNSVSSAFITQDLGDAVSAAVATCPEPIDYKVTAFMNCLKAACMSNVAVTSFINQATTALSGAAISGVPLLVASKPVPPKKPVAAVPPSSSGASAYSAGAFAYPGAGGAFPYAGAGAGAGGAPPMAGPAAYMAGAGAGGAPPAAGPAAYMAGAGAGGAPPAAGPAAYMAGAGAGAGAGSAPPLSGPAASAAYMAGAFPYTGAGAFPYAGASGGASGAGAIPYAGAGAGAGGATAPQPSSNAKPASSK